MHSLLVYVTLLLSRGGLGGGDPKPEDTGDEGEGDEELDAPALSPTPSADWPTAGSWEGGCGACRRITTLLGSCLAGGGKLGIDGRRDTSVPGIHSGLSGTLSPLWPCLGQCLAKNERTACHNR